MITSVKANEFINNNAPVFVEEGIEWETVYAIYQGGCASGAYMPAVTYHDALATMSEHGDEVLEYIENALGELPDVSGESWAGMACKYVSCAVELWAASVVSELELDNEDVIELTSEENDIFELLEEHDTLSLDDEGDRAKLAQALAEVLTWKKE